MSLQDTEIVKVPVTVTVNFNDGQRQPGDPPRSFSEGRGQRGLSCNSQEVTKMLGLYTEEQPRL